MVKLHLSTKILLAILLLLPAISWGQNNTGIVRHRDYQKLAQYNPYQLRIDSSFVVLEDLNEKKEINNIVATKQLYKSNLLVLKEDSEVFNKRESPHFVYPDWKLTDNLFELLHQPKSTKNIVILVFFAIDCKYLPKTSKTFRNTSVPYLK